MQHSIILKRKLKQHNMTTQHDNMLNYIINEEFLQHSILIAPVSLVQRFIFSIHNYLGGKLKII